MPTADDLFRPTGDQTGDRANDRADDRADDQAVQPAVAAVPDAPAAQGAPAQKRPSGRVRHDEKMTVYVTADELLDIEHARLSLRRHQGIAVDRGRLVREALAIVLADLEHHGDDSDLVKRLNR